MVQQERKYETSMKAAASARVNVYMRVPYVDVL